LDKGEIEMTIADKKHRQTQSLGEGRGICDWLKLFAISYPAFPTGCFERWK